MIPIWLFVCAATFIIARRFYTPRIAAWSVLLLNLFPAFFLKSIEYRTDNLWVGFWMAAFLVLTGGALTKRRMFAVGLLLGLATCVSLKTSLLLVSLLLAGIALWCFTVRPRSWRNAALIILPALLGLVIVPSIVAIAFARLGAWPELLYCNFTFNELISKSRPHAATIRLFYPIALAAIFYVARRLSFLAVLSLFYTATLVARLPRNPAGLRNHPLRMVRPDAAPRSGAGRDRPARALPARTRDSLAEERDARIHDDDGSGAPPDEAGRAADGLQGGDDLSLASLLLHP